ncbi:Ig-like domain-containing protein [Enterococcus sp. LJL98]
MFRKSVISLVASGLVMTTLVPVSFASESSESESKETMDVPANSGIAYPGVAEVHSEKSSADERSEQESEHTVSIPKEEESESIPNASAEETSKQESEEKKEKNQLKKVRAVEVVVNDWEHFATAFNNPQTTKITLAQNITKGALNLTKRTASLEIDGGGFDLHLKDNPIVVDSPSSTASVLKLHHFGVVTSDSNIVTSEGSISDKWRFEFGDFVVPKGKTTSVLVAKASKVLLFGELEVTTNAENFVIGSAIFADETKYTGVSLGAGKPLFSYPSNEKVRKQLDRNFEIGKNSVIHLSNQVKTTESFKSIIDEDFENILVEEGARLSIKSVIPAIRMGYVGDAADNVFSLLIQKDAVVTLDSETDGNVSYPPTLLFEGPREKKIVVENGGTFNVYQATSFNPLILYRGSNSLIHAKEGSTIDFVGNTERKPLNWGMISPMPELTNNNNNKLTIENPKHYNIQNKRVNQGAPAIKGEIGEFRMNIINSSISLWKQGVSGSPDRAFSYIESFKATPGAIGGLDKVQIKLPGVEKPAEFNESYTRIAGWNLQKPEVKWDAITDADKKMKARVIIGYSFSENQNEPPEELYPTESYPAFVNFYDETGRLLAKDVKTNNDGYAEYSFAKETFKQAGETFNAVARFANKTSDQVDTTVLDVTPPEPAQIDGGTKQVASIKTISGTGEVGSTVTLEKNGTAVTIPKTIVGNDGKWKIDLSKETLSKGDQLQVFLQDNAGSLAGKLPDLDALGTNNGQGNINPNVDEPFRDTLFRAATTIAILGELKFTSVPDTLDFGKQMIMSETQTITPEKPTKGLIVSDTREEKSNWDLLLAEKKPLTFGKKVLNDVLVYRTSDGRQIEINSGSNVIESNEASSNEKVDVSSKWNETYGLALTVPVTKQLLGDYSGELSWTLQSSPSNP